MNNEQKSIENTLGLLTLAETLGPVSPACKVMGHCQKNPRLVFAD